MGFLCFCVHYIGDNSGQYLAFSRHDSVANLQSFIL